jgi:NAD(P)H-nitrite reductase large subunit/predicted pyridoxine 5'-phosphate oxidase superfamily flavin-nucleotide-binding protein
VAAKRRLVVIGNGMAGARSVEEILARGGGEMFEIAMFGDEPFGNYNRIMLSAVLEGSTDAAAILLNPLQWYDEHAIRLRAGVRAQRIFRYARRVIGSDESQEPYDKLIIATGSHPFIPPLNGLTLPDGSVKPGIFGFRSLDDCQRIAAYAAGKRRAVVVGGGLLGLECARALVKFDVEVHIIHHATHLMNQQIDPPAGAILKALIEKMGIHVHLGAETRAIIGEERVTGLGFGDDQSMDCEMVVFAAGTRPNYEIARSCGLAVECAIVVDDQMRSVDDPHIYAVGECVQHGGRTYGLVAPLWEQAKVLADHITGRDPKAAYHGSRIATRLKVAGVELASMGTIEPGEERDEVVQFIEPRKGTYKKVLIRDGHVLGAILLGDISKAAYLLHAFDANTPLPEERVNLLFDIGAPPRQMTLEQIPMDALICNCNGVNMGALVNCVKAGRASAQAVMEATRAGTACGSCESMVREIVDWAGGGDAPRAPSTLPGSDGEHELQRKYSTALQALAFYKHQMLDHLNSAMRAFIARQEMMFVGTADRHGHAHTSFRAGPANFVKVLDERTIAYPEYRGNGVMSSLGNVAENPHVGLMFIDFTGDRIGLHVNGNARIVENEEFLQFLSGHPAREAVPGDPVLADLINSNPGSAERWVIVSVSDAFIHCSKHVPLMRKVDREIQWGTDDVRAKGGDYFGAASGQK